MFQGLFNLKKLFSKRYFVVFFDKENMPEEGTKIEVGELVAVFKKDSKIEIVPSPRLDWCGECKMEHGYDCPKETVWVCRKCGFREQK